MIDIYKALKEYNLHITVYDPWANPDVVKAEYGIELTNTLSKGAFDAVIAAVAHTQFSTLDILSLLKEKHVIFDVKGSLARNIVDGRL